MPEISFEELMPRKQVTEVEPEISMDAVLGKAAPTKSEDKLLSGYNRWVEEGIDNSPAMKAFIQRIEEVVPKAIKAALFPPREEPGAKRENLLTAPDATSGSIKAITGGLIGMGELGVAGITGLTNGLLKAFPGGKSPSEGFSSGMEGSQAFFQKAHEIAGAITTINLQPESEEEAAMSELLALLPEGFTALGDTVYEKTGSAIAGTGTTALLTLLTLKPSIVTKTFKGVKEKGKNPEMETAFDNLAKESPEGAKALIEHIKQADPELAKLLEERAAKAETITPAKKKVAGEKQAKREVEAKEIKYEDLLKTDEISYEQLIADMEKTVPSKATQQKSLANNASGESAASLEAISRVAQEQAAGQYRYRVKQDGTVEPLTGVDAVDAVAKPGEMIVQRGVGDQAYSILDRGGKSKEAAQGTLTATKPQLDTLSAKRMEERQVVVGEGMAETAGEGYAALKAPLPEVAPVVSAFSFRQKIPGFDFIEGKLRGYALEMVKTFAPEALGVQARKAAAIVSTAMSKQMQKDSAFYHRSLERISFWNKAGPERGMQFLREYEAGVVPKDPVLKNVAEGYKEWNKAILETDQKLGHKYEVKENYIYHLFENADKLAVFMTTRHGSKFGDPRFIKERTFELYDEAVRAGFKPKFKNPEEIMLARQHASDVAQMRIETLSRLADEGLAWRITKNRNQPPRGISASQWRAPNGQRYWVHDTAGQILHNAFNTTSLWTLEGLAGDAFQGAMFLKNTMVPIQLALSAFHPLHVATIDNATAMVRSTKRMFGEKETPLAWFGDMLKSTAYTELLKETTGQLGSAVGREAVGGNRMLKAWQGKLAEKDLTTADRVALQYMWDGGLIPEMSSQYKTKAIDNFRAALDKGQKRAAFHAPFAVLSAMNKPVFEIWIPSLKIASYLKDVQTAIKVDPSLVTNQIKRQEVFHRLAKSVDNRYGEMAYNTMFWNRWVKDLGVANTLSLGWQMGFLREYGGAVGDMGKVLRNKKIDPKSPDSAFLQHVKAGNLDRPLFVMFYTTQSLLYAGLMTWALTGKPPESLLDYTHPKNGELNEDGTDQRINTMFYPREFVAISKHIEQEGPVSGMAHLASNKASGVVGQVVEWSTGVNSFGQEIRDPDAPFYKQLEQTLGATLINLEPISVQATREGEDPLFAFAGFGIAPKYVTESDTQNAIRHTWQTYYAKKQTPYEKALYSKDVKKLRQYYAEGDSEKFSEIMDTMQEKYELTGIEMRRLQVGLNRQEDPTLAMFKNFTWQQQKKLLDKMTDEEREIYIPISNRQHIRYGYEPPESR